MEYHKQKPVVTQLYVSVREAGSCRVGRCVSGCMCVYEGIIGGLGVYTREERLPLHSISYAFPCNSPVLNIKTFSALYYSWVLINSSFFTHWEIKSAFLPITDVP